MRHKQLWFTSTLFEVEPGEDEATNPGCYGKQPAHWLRRKLVEKGYEAEEVIAEDWGWCVMCARKPFLLWVGCGNVEELGQSPQEPPHLGKDVTWTCFVAAEKPFLTGLFTRIDPAAVERLFDDVQDILNAELQITVIEEP